ncbi:zinc finger protein 574 [Corythoichthys intestinalis]|uniref:zinc finger protein 574 n=1 Tax=Corythoichthys intestinalis TaxID=161448 RepID=UPI0025A4D3B0|nr:zinc finger protein 574 [Corythoichthys intestinalis]XP_057690827.1 zinc finger protein 574 [Corythoichthys intestinalis]XP_057690828.1 zinc finger protein 574 [Corythoichthys intestinalis]XP_061788972.1 zinc finger protein 574 [Nerophis lumbriciformis]
METQSVYMCFPCYKEFNTLEEVLKHQVTCTAEEDQGDTSRVAPVIVPMLQTQPQLTQETLGTQIQVQLEQLPEQPVDDAEQKTEVMVQEAELSEDQLLDQPRILYQCGDCEELFKSLDMWQHHRKEGICLRTVIVGGPDTEPQSFLQPDEPQPMAQAVLNDDKPAEADGSAVVEEPQQVGETSSGNASDQTAPEVVKLSSSQEESSARRRGALKKPKPDPVLLCVDCGSCFGLVSELVAHRKTHGFEEALHHCTVCGESFLNTTLFLYHRKQHRQKGEGSATLATGLSEKTHLQSSVVDEQAPNGAQSASSTQRTELFLCIQCGASFSDAPTLTVHRKMMHDLDNPLHSCSHCSKTFMNTTQYLYHRRQHRVLECGPIDEGETADEMVSTLEEAESSKRPLSSPSATMESDAPVAKKSRPAFRVISKGNKDSGLKEDAEVAMTVDTTNLPPPAKLLQDWSRTALPHVCPYCGKTFTRRVFLRTHVYSHTGEKLFNCKVCSKSFTNSQSLLRHTMTHSGNRPFCCDVCGKDFTQAATLKRHQLIHTSNQPRRKRGRRPICAPDNDGVDGLFSCPLCPSHFNTEEQLNHHKLLHTSNPFPCPDCGEAFSRRKDLDLHSLTHQDKEPVVCSHCSAQFINEAVLDIHQQRCTGSEEDKNTGRGRGQGRGRSTGQIECDLCGHRCMTQEGLDLHRLSHTGQTPLKCPVRPCRRRFISNKALEEHVLAHCQGKMGKPKNRVRFECQVCFKGFAYNSTYQVHMRTHTDERPFECSTCGKRFRQLPHLQDHERIHSGVRPFCCWICGKSFSVAARLTEHARTHSGEKPYPCPNCPAAFRSRSNLDKHIRQHGDQAAQAAEEVASATEAAQVQKVLEGAKALSALATTTTQVEVDDNGMQTIYVLQAGEGGGEAVMIPAEELSGLDGTSQVVILPSSMLGAQGITIPTITMDGSEITMLEATQSPQHSIEFIVEETI